VSPYDCIFFKAIVKDGCGFEILLHTLLGGKIKEIQYGLAFLNKKGSKLK
jgi:hypothetical protein